MAIPALGTAPREFTYELAAQLLIEAIVVYLKDNPSTSIKEVILVQQRDDIHAAYRAVYTQVQQEAAAMAQAGEASIKQLHSIVLNDVSLEILSGDIEQVECVGRVVVSTAEDVESGKMKMDTPLSVDPSFQNLSLGSRQSTGIEGYPRTSQVRVVKLPRKKRLKCRQVLQVQSPLSLEDSEQTILDILITAERERLESVVFPASMLRSTEHSLQQKVESVYSIIIAFIREKEQHVVKSISVVVPEGKRRNSRKSTSAPDPR